VPETPPNDDIVKLADEISSYLQAHPDATDTLEGVITWWLTRQRYMQATAEVQCALDYLESRGVVKKIPTPGGGTVYSSAAPQKRGKDPR
jgi:hypothetical protein